MTVAGVQRETRIQWAAFAALSMLAASCVAILTRARGELFQPYFSRIPPLLAIAIVIGAGTISLHQLYTRYGFYVLKPGATSRGVAISAAVVLIFAVEVTLLDIVVRFPEDMNAPLPEALLFYPAIAYVVEIVFHALPLTLMFVILGRIRKGMIASRLVWISILLTALLEPTYQLAFVANPFSWTGLYLWIRLFAFSLIQLHIFRRYDFFSMYSFRLLYYAYWHIAWGTIRLHVLF